MQTANGGYFEQENPTFGVAAATGQYRRVKFDGDGLLTLDGATGNVHLGVTNRETFAAGKPVSLTLRTDEQIKRMIAGGVIGFGVEVFKAADGKVAATGSVRIGISVSSTTVDGDIVEVLEC